MTAHQRRPAFEWHDVKAEKNVRKHGISFDEAVTVFEDPLSISDSERIRIISSRLATTRERKHYEEE